MLFSGADLHVIVFVNVLLREAKYPPPPAPPPFAKWLGCCYKNARLLPDASPSAFFVVDVVCSQTTLCLGLLFYTPEQNENTYGKSLKDGSPTDGVVNPP